MQKIMIITIAVAALLGFLSTDTNAGTILRPEDVGIAKMYSYFFNWMRDDDGDGIPNCLDPDYVKPEDGTGYGKHKGTSTCSNECGNTQDRTRDRTRSHLNDCQKILISR